MATHGTFSSDIYNDTLITNYTNLDLATIELFKGYSAGLLQFGIAACFLLMVVGIPGNIITIIALTRYKKIRNATALFIINLSCSDLMFSCFNLPLTVSTYWQRSWTHGHTLCYILPFAKYTFVGVSIFTILTITVNRYIMVAHPRLYPKVFKPRQIAIIIAGLWFLSMVGLIPTCLGKYGRFGLDPKVGSCSLLRDEKGQSPKSYIVFVAFILPCTVMVLCYARIFFIVRKTTKISLPSNKLVSRKDEESLSADLSTSQFSRIPNYDHSTSVNKENSSASLNSNMRRYITLDSVTKEITKSRSENKLAPLKIHRTIVRKSKALFKLSLPTRKDRRLGTMIISIMISFCMCHLPITIVKVFVDESKNPTLCIASNILLFLSSSINPIIYVLMSNEYRKAYKYLLKRRGKTTLPLTKTLR